MNSLRELGEIIPMEYIHIPPNIVKWVFVIVVYFACIYLNTLKGIWIVPSPSTLLICHSLMDIKPDLSLQKGLAPQVVKPAGTRKYFLLPMRKILFSWSTQECTLSLLSKEKQTWSTFIPRVSIIHVYTSLTPPEGMTRRGVFTNLHVWGKPADFSVLMSWFCGKSPWKCLIEFSHAGTNFWLTFGCLLTQHKVSLKLFFLFDSVVAFHVYWFIYISQLWLF